MEWIQSMQKQEIDLIVNIQSLFARHEKLLEVISTIFGSTFIYLYIIPCLAALNIKLYHKALGCCLFSDFVNLILKWILAGDRPYWWVHEANLYTSLTRPTLYQTDRTCETSPGSPSGHLMVASSFFYVMLLAGEKLIVLHCRSCRRIMRYIARLIFAATLALLSVSRMYFATHFLHQCVLGAVLGISIAEILIFTTFTENVQDFDKQKWFKIACGMAASVVIIFWFLKWFTGNPMASVHMAFKHCNDPLHPRPETTVIFSFIRNLAKVAGLIMTAPLNVAAPSGLRLNPFKSIPFVACLMLLQRQFILWTPTNFKFIIFYSYTFVVYATFQYLFAAVVPRMCAGKSVKPKQN